MAPTTIEHRIVSMLTHPSFQGYQTLLRWLVEDDVGVRRHEALGLECSELLLERFILEILYYKSNGILWDAQEQWISQQPVCSWHGIGCRNGPVVDISLGT
jgi:hypothetical protein